MESAFFVILNLAEPPGCDCGERLEPRFGVAHSGIDGCRWPHSAKWGRQIQTFMAARPDWEKSGQPHRRVCRCFRRERKWTAMLEEYRVGLCLSDVWALLWGKASNAASCAARTAASSRTATPTASLASETAAVSRRANPTPATGPSGSFQQVWHNVGQEAKKLWQRQQIQQQGLTQQAQQQAWQFETEMQQTTRLMEHQKTRATPSKSNRPCNKHIRPNNNKPCRNNKHSKQHSKLKPCSSITRRHCNTSRRNKLRRSSKPTPYITYQSGVRAACGSQQSMQGAEARLTEQAQQLQQKPTTAEAMLASRQHRKPEPGTGSTRTMLQLATFFEPKAPHSWMYARMGVLKGPEAELSQQNDTKCTAEAGTPYCPAALQGREWFCQMCLRRHRVSAGRWGCKSHDRVKKRWNSRARGRRMGTSGPPRATKYNNGSLYRATAFSLRSRGGCPPQRNSYLWFLADSALKNSAHWLLCYEPCFCCRGFRRPTNLLVLKLGRVGVGWGGVG